MEELQLLEECKDNEQILRIKPGICIEVYKKYRSRCRESEAADVVCHPDHEQSQALIDIEDKICLTQKQAKKIDLLIQQNGRLLTAKP